MIGLVRISIISLISGAMAFVGVAFAAPQKRVALVIGNANYENISPLRNTKNDANLIADSLRRVGFDVTLETDLTYVSMRRAVRSFGARLRAAGPDAVGLFYYAGHGVQSRGVNYLLPLGAPIETEADLNFEAISAGDVINQMEFAGNTLNLLILDACRNNPFQAGFRSSSRGLARIESASGTLVAFAAAPGQVASDGTNGNSPYSAALADAMRVPGLSIEQVFKRARIAVEAATHGAQTPWEESSLKGDFFFMPPQRVAPPARPQAQAQAIGRRQSMEMEALFWRSIEDIGTDEAYDAYLAKYPNGTFAALAEMRKRSLSGMRGQPRPEPRIELTPQPPPAAASKQDPDLSPPSRPIPSGSLASTGSQSNNQKPDNAPIARTQAKEPDRQSTLPEPPPIRVSEHSAVLYATRDSNVRAGPGTEYKRVDVLETGQTVTVTGKVKGKSWYRIKTRRADTAYVYASLLTQKKPKARSEPDAVTIASATAGGQKKRLRSGDGGATAAAKARSIKITGKGDKTAAARSNCALLQVLDANSLCRGANGCPPGEYLYSVVLRNKAAKRLYVAYNFRDPGGSLTRGGLDIAPNSKIERPIGFGKLGFGPQWSDKDRRRRFHAARCGFNERTKFTWMK